MAKQWIFETLDRLFPEQPFRVLDLACGDCSPWVEYLKARPNCTYQGFDYNKTSLKKAQNQLRSITNAEADYGDAQKLSALEPVDVVTAFSALEHVVNLQAFCQTAYQALKKEGFAFLNYDIGHFRSQDKKERLMVPISQILAKLGLEGPYMKEVHDEKLLHLLQKIGFQVLEQKKHNITSLKADMKNQSETAIAEWYSFENKLNTLLSWDTLHQMMLSTTLLLKK